MHWPLRVWIRCLSTVIVIIEVALEAVRVCVFVLLRRVYHYHVSHTRVLYVLYVAYHLYYYQRLLNPSIIFDNSLKSHGNQH